MQKHLQVGSLKFSTQLTLSPGETRWVSVPGGAELTQPLHHPNSAVHISSSADISVVAFNRHDNTGDGAVVTPTDHLGVRYVVFTPAQGSPDKLLAIVNGDSHNQVTLMPATTVRVKAAGKWRRGKGVSVDLKPYETYLVRSRHTLTGIQVTSRQPVAVFAGHQCLALVSKCDHLYKQLPPLSQLGTEYMVPTTLAYGSKSWAYIVAAEDNTEVTVYKGKGSKKRLG